MSLPTENDTDLDMMCSPPWNINTTGEKLSHFLQLILKTDSNSEMRLWSHTTLCLLTPAPLAHHSSPPALVTLDGPALVPGTPATARPCYGLVQSHEVGSTAVT